MLLDPLRRSQMKSIIDVKSFGQVYAGSQQPQKHQHSIRFTKNERFQRLLSINNQRYNLRVILKRASGGFTRIYASVVCWEKAF
jgi:hypothetical protein